MGVLHRDPGDDVMVRVAIGLAAFLLGVALGVSASLEAALSGRCPVCRSLPTYEAYSQDGRCRSMKHDLDERGETYHAWMLCFEEK